MAFLLIRKGLLTPSMRNSYQIIGRQFKITQITKFSTSVHRFSNPNENTRSIFNEMLKTGKEKQRISMNHMYDTKDKAGARKVYAFVGFIIALTTGMYLFERAMDADCEAAKKENSKDKDSEPEKGPTDKKEKKKEKKEKDKEKDSESEKGQTDKKEKKKVKEEKDKDKDSESEKGQTDKKEKKIEKKEKDKDKEKKKDKKGKDKNKEKGKKKDGKKKFKAAIAESRDLVQRIKDEVGSPGLAVAVSVDGQIVWDEGFGYSDVENRVPCTSKSVIRIASISKCLTVAALGRLLEQDKVDLDKPVEFYVPDWPQKTADGEKVTITTRQLLSHMSGIRHYDKECGKKKDKNTAAPNKQKKSDGNEVPASVIAQSSSKEFKMSEYFIQKNYPSTAAAMELFKDDPLCFKPGSDFLYTTHGYTLVGAVIEAASGKKFPQIMRQLISDIGMENTYLDEHQPLIYNRAKSYRKNQRGRIVNAPYVDLSYKWAGGGLISTVCDVVKFGNAMLYSYQSHEGISPGLLKPETVKLLWTPVKGTKRESDSAGTYAMGWGVVPAGQKYGACKAEKFYASHTGGAIGASSALLVMPPSEDIVKSKQGKSVTPRGIVVGIIVNMESVGLNATAKQIAQIFSEAVYNESSEKL